MDYKMIQISNIKKLLLAISLMIIAIVADAAAQASGGLNIMFVNSINGMTQGWINPLVKIGIGVGISLWFIESFVQMINKGLYDDPGALLKFVYMRSIIFGVSTGIFWKFDLYQNITELFLDPARTLSNFGSDRGSFGLDAGDVWKQYTQWYIQDYGTLSKDVGKTNIPGQLGLLCYQVIYFLSAIVISIEIILLNLKFKLILFGGVIFAGCYSSDWAKQFWWKYVSALIGISFQVLVFCLIYKAFKDSINYKSMQNAISGGGTLTDNFLLQVIGCVIAAISLWIVPGYIGGAITGLGGGGGSAIDIVKSIGNSIQSAASKVSGGKPGGGGGGKPGGASPSVQAPIDKADKANALN
jgi:hypothetical protein